MIKTNLSKPIKEIRTNLNRKKKDFEPPTNLLTETKIEKQNNEELLNILKDPKIFDKITIEEFDKKIVGETEARRLIFLCANGRLIENNNIASYNLLVNDDAGSGKDHICKHTLEIIPKEQYIYKTRITPAVLTYWHNSTKEPDWTWNGKVFYNEDISEAVLNSDVFKVMCSSGSNATVVIEQEAIDLEIKGKPVMITTTATSIPNPELTRRFAIVNLSESKNQTKEIMKRHSEFAKEGMIPEYDEKIKEALKLLKRTKVKIPYAEKIYKHFPDSHVIMRTLYPRFLDLIKASTGFHQYQRDIDKEGYYIANEQDYEIAREGIETIKSNKYMIPLTITQKKILHKFDEERIKKEKAKENKEEKEEEKQKKSNTKQEKDAELKEDYTKNPKDYGLIGSLMALHNIFNFISLPALQTNLGILARYGIISTKINTDDYYHKEIMEYFLNIDYIKGMEKELPKFKELSNDL